MVRPFSYTEKDFRDDVEAVFFEAASSKGITVESIPQAFYSSDKNIQRELGYALSNAMENVVINQIAYLKQEDLNDGDCMIADTTGGFQSSVSGDNRQGHMHNISLNTECAGFNFSIHCLFTAQSYLSNYNLGAQIQKIREIVSEESSLPKPTRTVVVLAVEVDGEQVTRDGLVFNIGDSYSGSEVKILDHFEVDIPTEDADLYSRMYDHIKRTEGEA